MLKPRDALVSTYPSVPWIHAGSVTGIVVGVSGSWIWPWQGNFIEIACWYLKQY